MTPEQVATLFTPLTTVEVNQIVLVITTDKYLFVGRVERFEDGVITLLREDHDTTLCDDLYQIYVYNKLVPYQPAIYAYNERMVRPCKFTRQNKPTQRISIKWDQDKINVQE